MNTSFQMNLNINKLKSQGNLAMNKKDPTLHTENAFYLTIWNYQIEPGIGQINDIAHIESPF